MNVENTDAWLQSAVSTNVWEACGKPFSEAGSYDLILLMGCYLLWDCCLWPQEILTVYREVEQHVIFRLYRTQTLQTKCRFYLGSGLGLGLFVSRLCAESYDGEFQPVIGTEGSCPASEFSTKSSWNSMKNWEDIPLFEHRTVGMLHCFNTSLERAMHSLNGRSEGVFPDLFYTQSIYP